MRLLTLIVLALCAHQALSYQVIETEGTKWTLAGPLKYRLYHTAQHKKASAVFLAMHGCKIDSKSFVDLAQLKKYVARDNIVVIAPDQSRMRNQDNCWAWFMPYNQIRISGEPYMIMTLVDSVLRNLDVPSVPLYGIGFSSGGAMLAILAATNRDRFRGVAIHSAPTYLAASDPLTAKHILRYGSAVGDSVAATRVYWAGRGKNLPKVIVLQGLQDTRLYPINSNQLAQQMAVAADLVDDNLPNHTFPWEPTQSKVYKTKFGYDYKMDFYGSLRSGKVVYVSVGQLAHKWSGGPSTHPYGDPKGPDATRLFTLF